MDTQKKQRKPRKKMTDEEKARKSALQKATYRKNNIAKNTKFNEDIINKICQYMELKDFDIKGDRQKIYEIQKDLYHKSYKNKVAIILMDIFMRYIKI